MPTYQVVAPDGSVHEKRTNRVYTHALIRRNHGADRYFVSWAGSREKAEREARVLVTIRDHNEVVPVTEVTG